MDAWNLVQKILEVTQHEKLKPKIDRCEKTNDMGHNHVSPEHVLIIGKQASSLAMQENPFSVSIKKQFCIPYKLHCTVILQQQYDNAT